MKDQVEKKESISIAPEKCKTFVTSSTHDDGTKKWLKELPLQVRKQIATNLRLLILDDLTCLSLRL